MFHLVSLFCEISLDVALVFCVVLVGFVCLFVCLFGFCCLFFLLWFWVAVFFQ